MTWHDDPKHPFAGIAEKLKRADENIVNLESEIRVFFQKCPYPAIPDPKDKTWQEAIDYHRQIKFPPRFSVIAGEVVHHLRSCLDHIVWHFSSAAARRDHAVAIEFPIFPEPLTNKTKTRFEGKIQGITNPNVRAIIERLQPYHRGADAANDPLLIVHDMDRFDKHRELVLVSPSAQMEFAAGTPLKIVEAAVAYTQGKTISRDMMIAVGREIKKHHKVTPDVAFAQFGKWKTQPVVPSLTELLHAVSDVVELFVAEV